MSDNLFTIDIVLLNHDLHGKDRVTARGVLVAECLGSLALLNAPLKNLEDVADAENSDLFKILTDHALLHVFAKLELLLSGSVQQILELFVICIPVPYTLPSLRGSANGKHVVL